MGQSTGQTTWFLKQKLEGEEKDEGIGNYKLKEIKRNIKAIIKCAPYLDQKLINQDSWGDNVLVC